MIKVVVLLFVFVLGILLRQLRAIQKKHITLLNKLIIFFFIPLITILNIPELELSYELLWLSVSPYLVFIFGSIYFSFFRKLKLIDKETTIALILTGGISSTSFVGFPIFHLLYGDIGLSYGVLLSMGGTILVFNTLGMGLLIQYCQRSVSPLKILKTIFTFFPFVIFLVAIGMNILSIRLPLSLNKVIGFLVSPFSIFAILAIGMQVELGSFKNFRKELFIGQSYKLLVAPLLIYFIGLLFYVSENLIFKIAVLGSAIGSMNAISIMTADKKLKPELAIAMPALGIPLSIISLFIIYFIIK